MKKENGKCIYIFLLETPLVLLIKNELSCSVDSSALGQGDI
jgi:hypothetical protein